MQAIPEIGDHTIKKQKRETYTPVPDTILTGVAAAGQTGNTIVGGLETPGGATTSLTEIGQGRKMVVDISLKRAGKTLQTLTWEALRVFKTFLRAKSTLFLKINKRHGQVLSLILCSQHSRTASPSQRSL